MLEEFPKINEKQKTNHISKKLNEVLAREKPYIPHKLLNTQQKEKILKTPKKKKERKIGYRKTKIRLIAYFASETTQGRRQ